MHPEQHILDDGAKQGVSDVPSPLVESSAVRSSRADLLTPEKLAYAYEYCRLVSWKHAKTFYFATHFLPKQKRTSVYAVYALCRYVDDLVDRSEDKFSRSSLTKENIVSLLSQWRADLDVCYTGEVLDNPIMLAWHDMLKRYTIPKSLPMELIDGVCMDLTTSHYESFDQLYVYCYKVASVVGLMTAEIFGYESQAALDYAVKLGIAMQLTNILRDVGEDAQKGRVYLPKEDLVRFGYSEAELQQGVINENFAKLMQFQIERARRFYAESDKGIPMLTKDSRLAVRLSRVNYSKILDSIEKNGYDVFSRRAYVSLTGKLINLPYLWLRTTLS